MKLSKRMQTIANLINKCSTLADVGCDHGKILLYALEYDIAKNVIASDISEKSVNKAKLLLEKNNFENFNIIVSDGFLNYPKNILNKIDCVIISGLGGLEIVEILKGLLKNNLNNLKLKQIVLQPQNNEILLREFLISNKLFINIDKIVKDNGKFYSVIDINIIKNDIMQKLRKLDVIFGKTNFLVKNNDFVDFLNVELNKNYSYLTNASKKSAKAIKKNVKLFLKAQKLINKFNNAK
jgi:tRNA (adenine22-N1)-methyltransferase